MSVPDSVGKCPPLSEEVLDRAVEAVSEAREGVRRGMHVNTTHGYREQENYAIVDRLAPVIAEAGYRAGQADAIGYEGTQAEQFVQAQESAFDTGRSEGYRAGYEAGIEEAKARIEAELDKPGARDGAGFEAGLETALAALTDTEGRDE